MRTGQPSPGNRSPTAGVLWAAGFLVGGLWLVGRLQSVVVPLLLGWFIAYALDPVLDRLEARRVPRPLGILVLLAAAFVALGVLVLLVVPALADQAREAFGALPGYVEAARRALEPRLERLLGRPVPALEDAEAWARALAALKGAVPDLGTRLAGAAAQVLANAWGVVSTVLGLALIPVFAFYMLLDLNGLGDRAVSLLPVRHQPLGRRILARSDEVLGAFVRGQLTVCVILASVYSLGLTLVGIDMPWVVGVLSGALFIVPYLGTLVGLVLASLLALLKFGDWAHLLGVWGVFAAGQALEGFVLTPRIVGDRVGLHPLAVLVAVLAGGELFGVVGVLLAVPGAAVLRVGLAEFLDRYRRSSLYLGEL